MATKRKRSRPTKASRHVLVREAVSLYDAKTRLSALVEQAAGGAEIVITKSGKPKALLVPLGHEAPARRSGRGRGKWRAAADFDAPLPAEVLAAFEGREE
jgi:prevent-host-death family protein